MDFKPFKIGRYLLLERLAVGGMAEVYRATAKGAGGFEKQLAIKRILPNYASNDEFRRMFEYEARLSSMLTHSNIVQIYDFEKSGEDYLLAMEYVNGKNLRQFINKARKMNIGLPVELSVFVLNEVCKGLEYAHTKRDDITGRSLNVIHRDMSPQNIMISYDGAVKIVDFGIAKAKDRVDETRSGVIKGKFSYMSPEQANGESVDHRSDIFSTGIILWELVTGKRLFASENDLQTLKMIQDCLVKKPSSLNPRVPPELDRILIKSLTKDLSLRYQNASEFNQDLQRFLAKFFASFGQRDIGLIMQTVFAQEIEQEKKRVELLRSQSIPFSQGVAPNKESKDLDSIEAVLDGTQTKSEQREVSAVTEASEAGNSIAEEDISISQIAQQPTSLNAGSVTGNEVTRVEDLVQEDPSVPTSPKPRDTQTQGSVADKTGDSGMPLINLDGSGKRNQTYTPTPTPTAARMSKPDFLMDNHEFLAHEKKLNRFNQADSAPSPTGEAPANENALQVEDSVSVSVATGPKRAPSSRGFESPTEDFSHERDQYTESRPRWLASLFTIFIGIGFIWFAYHFLKSGKATELIQSLATEETAAKPERETAVEEVSTPETAAIPPGECVVSIDSDPRGAKIWIEGRERGTTSTRLLVPCKSAFSYTLELRGYEKVSENMVAKDRQQGVFKTLKRIPTAELEVISGQNLSVSIDGEFLQDVESNSRAFFDVRANVKHQVRFKNEVLEIDFSKEVFLEEGKKEVLNVDQLMLRAPTKK